MKPAPSTPRPARSVVSRAATAAGAAAALLLFAAAVWHVPVRRLESRIALARAAEPRDGGDADWPQWRGPQRDGRAPAIPETLAWPGKLETRWRIAVGEGHSAPVESGSRVYIFSREGGDEVLRCIDLERGAELWKKTCAAPYVVNPEAAAHGAGPKSTPAIAGGRVYTLGIGGILSAFDAASGELLWRKDFAGELAATSPLYGTAMSPLVADGLCIVHAGGHDAGALRAFDAASGDVRWSLDGDGPAYTSPIVAELGGETVLVTQTQSRLVGVGLRDGRLLWHVPFTTRWDQNSVTPLCWKDRIIYSGYDQPVRALEVRKDGGRWTTRQAWTAAGAAFFMSSPVGDGERVYGMSQRSGGQLVAIDPESGAILWKGPGRLGENASLVLAGALLLVLTTGGELIVARASGKEYQELRRYEVAASPTWAHLAVAGGSILVKDRTHLIALRLPRAELSSPRAELSSPRAELSSPRAELSSPRAELAPPREKLSPPQGER